MKIKIVLSTLLPLFVASACSEDVTDDTPIPQKPETLVARGLPTVGDRLYDSSKLHQINLEAEGIEAMLGGNGGGVFEAPIDMTFDGESIPSVQLKRKGNTSGGPNVEIPPFEIDLDFYKEENHFDGIDKFNLHNHYVDESFQRNDLAYEFYRRAGVPAPRTSFAQVAFNGVFVGIFTITEQIDNTFIKQNFSSKDGAVVKGMIYPEDGAYAKTGTTDAYDNYRDNVREDNYSTLVDQQNFFRAAATDLMIKDGDSYAASSHNFIMYHDPLVDKLHQVTWDHNLAFNNEFDHNSIFPNRALISEIYQSSSHRDDYLQIVCDLIALQSSKNFVGDRVKHNYDIMSSNTAGIEILDPKPLLDIMNFQFDFFKEKLKNEGYESCNTLDMPIQKGDLVIHEISANNRGSSDWIEISNTTSTDIVLGPYFYLSNDKDTPKKWRFKANTIVPSEGVLRIWADREVAQEGHHTNFRLNKSGGDVIFSFEDMTIIDSFSYEE